MRALGHLVREECHKIMICSYREFSADVDVIDERDHPGVHMHHALHLQNVVEELYLSHIHNRSGSIFKQGKERVWE